MQKCWQSPRGEEISLPTEEISRLGLMLCHQIHYYQGEKKPQIPPSTHPPDRGSQESSSHMYSLWNGLPKWAL